MALLSLKDVSVTYHSGGRDVHAINHVSLEIEKGESLGICSRWTMRRSRPCDGRSWQSCSRRP